MDSDSLPNLPLREEARSLPQLTSLDYDPFEDFDHPSQCRSTSANGDDYSTPPDLDPEGYNRPSSPLEGNEDHSDYFHTRTQNQSLSTTDTGHATSSTSVSSPRPRFWNSADSGDFECAVAGEYSPYDDEDLPTDPERSHHSATERLQSSQSMNFLNMKAPPILPSHLQRQASLPMSSATFDLAYFLKNTGPPGQRGGVPTSAEDAVARRKSKHKSPLRFLRVGARRNLASRVGSVEGPLPDERDSYSPKSFIPPEGVVQKLTADGKKYLQIVTEDKSATCHLDLPYGESDSRKKHSVAFSDRTDTLETDVLESWLSTFALQKPADEEPRPEHNLSKSLKLVKHHDQFETRHHEGDLASAVQDTDLLMVQGHAAVKHISCTAELIDEPDVMDLQSPAPDAKAALFSNPPSTRQSAADMPETEAPVVEHASDSDSVELPEFPQPPQADESLTSFEKGKERLAGQGMRRPSPEQVKEVDERPEPPPKDDVKGSICNDSCVGHRDPSDFGLGVKDSIRKSREERIRARKLRDMQRAKGSIDEVIGRTVETPTSPASQNSEKAYEKSPASEKQPEVSPTKIVEEPERPQSDLSTIRSSERSTVRSSVDSVPLDNDHSRHVSIDTVSTAPTPSFTTGYTPPLSRMSLALTPIMLVAEQIPVTKSKPTRKPARLILRDRQTSGSSIIAAHEPIESNAESAPLAPTAKDFTDSLQTAASSNEKPTSRQDSEHLVKDDIVPSRVSSHKYVQISEPEMTPENTELHHLSTPATMSPNPTTASSTPATTITTATPETATPPINKTLHRHTPSHASHASRASIASSLPTPAGISAPREQRLEARVEGLERENRLLEAALMAVLKSGGRLNKCPCQTSHRESVGSARTEEERETRVGALEVYLATRVGNGGV